MERPEFHHSGQRVQYISYLRVFSGMAEQTNRYLWKIQNNISCSNIIRHFGDYFLHGQSYSLQNVIDLGDDLSYDAVVCGCLLASYSGNIYFAGIGNKYFMKDDPLMTWCNSNYQAILQQMYTKILLYLNTLELGDVTSIIKQYTLHMITYDVHCRRQLIDWHGDRAKV
jgi:hypothetical protein